MSPSLRLLPLLGAMIVSACATNSNKPIVSEGVFLKVKEISPFSPSYDVELKRGYIVHRTLYNGEVKARRRVKFEVSEFEEFVNDLKRIGLNQWSARYELVEDPNVIYSSSVDWAIRVKFRDFDVSTSGESFPSDDPVIGVPGKTDRFREFENLLKHLLRCKDLRIW